MKPKDDGSGNPFEAYSTQSNGELRKFSDELLENFKGKMLEIYIGDQYETLNYEEYSVPQNCIIYGKLIDVLDRFIIVDCLFIDKKKKTIHPNNRVYINAFQIRMMTELNSVGSLDDIFLSSKDAEKVKAYALQLMSVTIKK